MPSTLSPFRTQEIYLLERYISPAYFALARDAWLRMVEHAELSLEISRPDPASKSEVRRWFGSGGSYWEQYVPAALRTTAEHLCDGYLRLSQGDITGLGSAEGPQGQIRMLMEFTTNWMTEVDAARHSQLLDEATCRASNISTTCYAHWPPDMLGHDYDEEFLGPLDAPDEWPSYTLHNDIRVATGEAIQITGIYVPDAPYAAPQFLSKWLETAPSMYIVADRNKIKTEEDQYKSIDYVERPCVWTLVKPWQAVAAGYGQP